MIPMVDAGSGKVVQLGEKVSMGTAAYRVEGLDAGVLSAKVRVRTWDMDGKELGVKTQSLPIHYFPKLLYGARFPVDATRVLIIPS
jgi:hypothetical protein